MDTIKGHHLPDVSDVQQLTRQGVHDIHIGPETPVLFIHRGRRQTEDGTPVHHPQAARHRDNSREPYFIGDYKDTFDGDHYVVVPGYSTAPYAAALHFQKRAVVPGSRNPETNVQVSFIAIIGVVEPHPGGGFRVLKAVDDQADWLPFTDEECALYEIAFEALDREALTNPIDRKVEVRGIHDAPGSGATSRVRASGAKGSASGGSRRRTQIETSDPSVLQAPTPGENAAIREAAEGQAARGGADEPPDPVGDQAEPPAAPAGRARSGRSRR